VSLLSSATTTATHTRRALLLGIRDNDRVSGGTTTHLLAELLEELTSLLTSDKLELVAATTRDGRRVSGRAVEGDKSFRGRCRHSVLYYLEEKFLTHRG
jgi:hypothetical protein